MLSTVVEVADHSDVAVVEVVVVDGVVVVDDVAAQSRRRKKMRYDGAADVDDAPCGCQRVSLAMSPPVLPRPEEAHRAHIGFARTVWPCRVITIVTPCRCSLAVVDDAVIAVVEVASCRKVCQRTLGVHIVDEATVVC
jgi:hypothetical protein